MKIKAIVTINIGLYMDIRPEIEIEVPDGLENEDLVEYLHTTYKGILAEKEKRDMAGPLLVKSHKRAVKSEKKDVARDAAEHDAGSSINDIIPPDTGTE